MSDFDMFGTDPSSYTQQARRSLRSIFGDEFQSDTTKQQHSNSASPSHAQNIVPAKNTMESMQSAAGSMPCIPTPDSIFNPFNNPFNNRTSSTDIPQVPIQSTAIHQESFDFDSFGALQRFEFIKGEETCTVPQRQQHISLPLNYQMSKGNITSDTHQKSDVTVGPYSKHPRRRGSRSDMRSHSENHSPVLHMRTSKGEQPSIGNASGFGSKAGYNASGNNLDEDSLEAFNALQLNFISTMPSAQQANFNPVSFDLSGAVASKPHGITRSVSLNHTDSAAGNVNVKGETQVGEFLILSTAAYLNQQQSWMEQLPGLQESTFHSNGGRIHNNTIDWNAYEWIEQQLNRTDETIKAVTEKMTAMESSSNAISPSELSHVSAQVSHRSADFLSSQGNPNISSPISDPPSATIPSTEQIYPQRVNVLQRASSDVRFAELPLGTKPSTTETHSRVSQQPAAQPLTHAPLNRMLSESISSSRGRGIDQSKPSHSHGPYRSQSLTNRIPAPVSTKRVGRKVKPKKVCSNCNVTASMLWRKGRDGNYLCNACGLYERVNHAPRPEMLFKESEQRW
ncbi:hypothetical protein SARC_04956 [Sphaeroforma arctica JP610]|uniref:GATA-type domain-containing protein n=1 Tax=Sphaeroforma arctica JP610 TaxID=667725 RepID=A0A0L0G3J1_9EUKA|nr:hypothetical protein SARC_04956 [Sphaeroforma arctica JP610]KNC82768.1 hypothetical protein SARC_04956 [Sphaeroforma arctica JP610]|eukprot:XP_014156670.1 hypothetical protein SARC_04956 [Sphaeroforma arctica JP610]